VKNQSFVWGNELLSASGDSSFHYLTDHLGSPIRLMGENESDALAYDEFGVAMVQAGQNTGSFSQPFGFTGYQTDSISGLYYAQVRYYEPDLGRFTAQDTHWNPDNMIFGDDWLGFGENTVIPDMTSIIQSGNLYVYCLSNPLIFIDYTAFKAGDPFKSMNAAAKDFGKNYYGITEFSRFELGSYIYEKNGKYYYTEPKISEPHNAGKGLSESWKSRPEGVAIKDRIATLHTHPNRPEFSQGDRDHAHNTKIPIYVMGPGGVIFKYNPATSKTTTLGKSEFAKLSVKEKEALIKQLADAWNKHIDECQNCKNRKWPNN